MAKSNIKRQLSRKFVFAPQQYQPKYQNGGKSQAFAVKDQKIGPKAFRGLLKTIRSFKSIQELHLDLKG